MPLQEIANFINTKAKAVDNVHACRISMPRHGEDSDKGVRVDCLFRVGRLAMPL